MPKLTQKMLLDLLSEEKTKAQKVGENMAVLEKGLTIRHKDSGLEYTIAQVAPRAVVLQTPEGEPFRVDQEELKKNYETA